MNLGTGICLRANNRRSVDLPLPLGPTSPYRRPCTTLKVVFFISSLPFAMTENPSTLMSRPRSAARSISSTCRASRTCAVCPPRLPSVSWTQPAHWHTHTPHDCLSLSLTVNASSSSTMASRLSSAMRAAFCASFTAFFFESLSVAIFDKSTSRTALVSASNSTSSSDGGRSISPK